jgi:hypothetical protein
MKSTLQNSYTRYYRHSVPSPNLLLPITEDTSDMEVLV